nr:hypothetical protein [Candidatus Njordarchaeota archaeon]
MSEGWEPAAATNSEEKKKELRKAYRKLKGVRCQISMKLRELEKVTRQTRYTVKDDGRISLEEDGKEEAPDEELIGEKEESKEKRLRAAQSDVRNLLDHKTRLRKRFQKLQEELCKE